MTMFAYWRPERLGEFNCNHEPTPFLCSRCVRPPFGADAALRGAGRRAELTTTTKPIDDS